MAEYIEKEALLKRLKFKRDTDTNMDGRKRYGLDSAISQVRKAPIADAVEVKYGEWLPSRNGINPIRCDKCNTPALFVQEQDGFGGFGFYRHPSNFCPNCGAKMDRKEVAK